MRTNYNTKQKQIILSCLIENKDNSLTVSQISNYLKEKGQSVGITTIYRYLDDLVINGIIKKFVESTGSKYQYVDKECCHHYHLKCNNCGKLIHLECDEINTLNNHIMMDHGFKMDNKKTIIYGICSLCEVKK